MKVQLPAQHPGEVPVDDAEQLGSAQGQDDCVENTELKMKEDQKIT